VYRSKKPWAKIKTADQISDAIFYGALGVIIGGRTGYMLFYDFLPFIHQPWTIFEVWDGGMSFHGGLIGVITAMWLYSRKLKISIFDLTDFFAPMVPIGLGLGRLGNFINDELWGRVTDSPIGMIFPTGGPWPRYPSQLIEFSLEGVVLFLILWCYSNKPRPKMAVSALFLMCYALFRFSAEFFRQPDPQLGFIAFGWLTMGQILCLPMLLLGIYLWFKKSG
jgi:phosphatidylglycerol:prolipoprotein diacylglycerol transferase